MSKNLVIVESPRKAKTITKILGNDYTIMASMGHIRDLPEKGLGVDVEDHFKPTYKLSGTRKNVISDLTKAVQKADNVYLAPDPDREGEAIAWHLYEVLRAKNKKAEFHRVTFHEITKGAVQESFDHPGEINMNLVDAQQARRVLDRLVGYQVSPLLWKKVVRGTSAGRVQSVALRLICERQAEIDSFEPQEYWLLDGTFKKDDAPRKFVAKMARLDGKKIEVDNGILANELAEDSLGLNYEVVDVKRVPRQRRAQAPFITSTLQQAASANLRMSPEQTMRTAQQLYEGLEGGDGDSGGLITYMRTDSFNIATVAQDAAREFIGKEYGPDFVPAKPNFYKSKGPAQEAHEAIRPTDVHMTPEKAAKSLDSRQARLYALIWKRFVASQMAPAKMSQHTIEMSNPAGTGKHVYLFRCTSTKTIFPGYMQVYNLQDVKEDAQEEENQRDLPDLKKGDKTLLLDLAKEQKFTEPPPQFSEAMLVRELDKNGIGRPSTYASIINTIKNRKYVENEKSKLLPTELGKNVNSYLVNNLGALFQVSFTAGMESELDNVEQGKIEWADMLEKFYEKFNTWVTEAGEKTNVPAEEKVRGVLAIFHDGITWAPAEKVGRRTYDDQKFQKSLIEQLDKGKKLSDKQWNALLTLATRYEEQLPNLQSTIDELGLRDDFQPVYDKIKTAADTEPDEASLRLCTLFETVTEWATPANAKARDDKAFYESLKEQASRKPLTERQQGALKSLIRKYNEQIPTYAALQEELGLLSTENAASGDTIKGMIAMTKDIEKWAEPTKRGRRTYDDKAFVESIEKQFESKGDLSDRQVAAFTKTIAKYKDQIKDFENRCKALGVEASGGKENTDEKTDVDCPKCNENKMVKKAWRGRVFYGCGGYPKCKYSVNSLDKVGQE